MATPGANNLQCEDGGPGAEGSFGSACPLGSDCNDCGPRCSDQPGLRLIYQVVAQYLVQGDVATFDRSSFVNAFATLVNVPTDAVRISSVSPGSVMVIVHADVANEDQARLKVLNLQAMSKDQLSQRLRVTVLTAYQPKTAYAVSADLPLSSPSPSPDPSPSPSPSPDPSPSLSCKDVPEQCTPALYGRMPYLSDCGISGPLGYECCKWITLGCQVCLRDTQLTILSFVHQGLLTSPPMCAVPLLLSVLVPSIAASHFERHWRQLQLLARLRLESFLRLQPAWRWQMPAHANESFDLRHCRPPTFRGLFENASGR